MMEESFLTKVLIHNIVKAVARSPYSPSSSSKLIPMADSSFGPEAKMVATFQLPTLFRIGAARRCCLRDAVICLLGIGSHGMDTQNERPTEHPALFSLDPGHLSL